MVNKLVDTPNPTLVTLRDNKAKWNLPEYRRTGYRNLHKINRYGLLLRSDYVLLLNENSKDEIDKINSVREMTSHKSFCSLIVGRGQEIFFEKYAKDFSSETPHTIMSISKMFLNLFVGELVEKGELQLEKPIGYYLPNIGEGYSKATVQNVLNMNIINAFTEDYTDPYTSSFLHEPVCGWRLPEDPSYKIGQEEFLNSILSIEGENLKNNSELSHYKSANTDVLGVIVERVSGKKLKDWLLEAVEAAGFEDAMYMGTDRNSMPWISGGGCLISRDFLRLGLLFSRKGHGVENRKVGSEKFLSETLVNKGTKYMELSQNKFLYYSNSSMKCGDWIGHSGLGGQFLAINLKNGIVASYFSVIETDSGTDENYKRDMINMLDEVVNKNF